MRSDSSTKITRRASICDSGKGDTLFIKSPKGFFSREVERMKGETSGFRDVKRFPDFISNMDLTEKVIYGIGERFPP